MPGDVPIEERLALLEEREREIVALKRALLDRLDLVRRGIKLFDAETRERLLALRELEALARAERLELAALVEEARDEVLSRRSGPRQPPLPTIEQVERDLRRFLPAERA